MTYLDLVYTKENGTTETVKVNANFLGTWKNGDNVFVITEDSVKFGNIDLTVVSCNETELVVYGTGFPQDTIKLSEDKQSFVFSSVTYTKDETTTELAILAKYLGSWYGSDDYTKLVIGETNASLTDFTFVEYVSCTDSNIVIAFSDLTESFNITFTYENGKLIASNLNDIVFSQQNQEVEVVKVNSNFVGTWVNDVSSFVITEDSVTYNGKALTVVSCTEAELTVYGNEFPQVTLKLSTDKNSIVFDNYTYTKKNLELKVPSYFIGKWVDSTNSSYKLEITESKLIINGGLELTVSAVEENKVVFGSDSSKMDLTYIKDTNTLTDGQYTFVVDNSIDSSVIPNAFIGEWASTDNTVVVFEEKRVKYGENYAQEFTVVDEKTVIISLYGSDITFKLNDDGTITSRYSGSENTILTKK